MCGNKVRALSPRLSMHWAKTPVRCGVLWKAATGSRAPVLDPGARKTKTGYFGALARDGRPWGGTAPPGVVFIYVPGRGGQHAERILQGFGGILQVDGYAAYKA